MTDQPPPGLMRDHNEPQELDMNDAAAIASLVKVAGDTLYTVDSQNVGGNSQIKALQMDGKKIITDLPINQPPRPVQAQPPPQPQPVHHPQPIPAPALAQPLPPPPQPMMAAVNPDLENRVRELEAIVESYKKITKFKRGVSYTINTLKIKGEFRDPGTILDIVSSELAKGTKTITIKLNAPKNTKSS
ncbi:hypothetical protein CL634_09810 [bacterium]|nr:hypothetical protein [bacterium]|tara:strand:- start:107 stop:670 length:564 start_codon:yes stop_codon:yes gene_type:complete